MASRLSKVSLLSKRCHFIKGVTLAKRRHLIKGVTSAKRHHFIRGVTHIKCVTSIEGCHLIKGITPTKRRHFIRGVTHIKCVTSIDGRHLARGTTLQKGVTLDIRHHFGQNAPPYKEPYSVQLLPKCVMSKLHMPKWVMSESSCISLCLSHQVRRCVSSFTARDFLFQCLYDMLCCYNSQSIFSSCVLNLVMFMKVMVLGPTLASYTNSTQDRVTN